ncbi:MAG: DNA-directed RNA polymerase III subunit RPC10 [Amphiamblys sp. WSBS2006]|nr:MAG: DNA-directed RNA polymerase III subunit RPC10 [Amphiamblys sp. WSBS2006]
MLLCPHCLNILVATKAAERQNILSCPTCAYRKNICEPVINTIVYTERAEVEEIDAAQKKGGDITDTVCPNCAHTKAFYIQMQTRSADEGSTLFYKCCECGHSWKEA